MVCIRSVVRVVEVVILGFIVLYVNCFMSGEWVILCVS